MGCAFVCLDKPCGSYCQKVLREHKALVSRRSRRGLSFAARIAALVSWLSDRRLYRGAQRSALAACITAQRSPLVSRRSGIDRRSYRGAQGLTAARIAALRLHGFSSID